MKKLLALILASIIAASALLVSCENKTDAEPEDSSTDAVYSEEKVEKSEITSADGSFVFDLLENGTARITSYLSEKEEQLEIPSVIDGYTVSEIGKNCFEAHTELKNVTVPDTVTRIFPYAFSKSSGISSSTA